MKIERAKNPVNFVTYNDLEEGELYLQSGDSIEDVFLMTDEDTIIYVFSGTQYDLSSDRFNEGATFEKLSAKLVIE